MIKKLGAGILLSLLKAGIGPILSMVLGMIDPAQLADRIGPVLKKQMEKVPAPVQDSIVLALEKLYLFAKELQDELKTKAKGETS